MLNHMKFRTHLLALTLFALLVSGCADSAGIIWHSYVHPSGETRYDLHLASYKRGLFFGSCGPSTYSLKWEYRIELKGFGPSYTKETIELQDGGLHRIHVDSGSILVDEGRKSAKIDITVVRDSKAQPFPHNGIYKMRKEP